MFCVSDEWKIQHINVKAAFLNEDIDRDVFVYHAYNFLAEERRGTVCKQQKAFYGLRQAPLQWFKKLSDYLIKEANFYLLSSYNSVFMKHGDGATILILANGDDFLYLRSKFTVFDASAWEFLDFFDGCAELLEWYLGVNFTASSDFIQVCQKSYIQ